MDSPTNAKMNELSEVDLIVHYMRQSKMDSVRKELESLVKTRDCKPENSMRSLNASNILKGITEIFARASNNAPLP